MGECRRLELLAKTEEDIEEVRALNFAAADLVDVFAVVVIVVLVLVVETSLL